MSERHFRIGAVERLTGVSAHTIRVWERRYGLLHPERTPGGTREYTEQDVACLRLINELVQRGYAIGTLAALPMEELQAVLQQHQQQAAKEPNVTSSATHLLDSLRRDFLEAVTDFRLVDAEDLLGRAVASVSLGVLIYELIAPLMQEVGKRWEEGQFRVAHEHAISAMVRGQLGTLMHRVGQPRGVIVAGTPSGEAHEFGALLATLIAVHCGWQVIYLGPNLPAEEIAYAAVTANARFVLLSAVSLSQDNAAQQLRSLREVLPLGIHVIAGGASLANLTQVVEGVKVEQNLNALETSLKFGY